MILNLYFARRFLSTFLVISLAFLTLILLLDFLEQVRKFGGQDLGLGRIVGLVALSAPSRYYQIMPLIMVLSSIALFLGLARSSELVVARAAGRSAFRSALPPVYMALLVGILAVSILNPIVAITEKEYEARSAALNGDEVSSLSVSATGFWLRQGSPDRQTVIHAKRANLDGTQLFDVTLYAFAQDGKALDRTTAASASLQDGFWQLSDAKTWPLNRLFNPERGAVTEAALQIPTDLTRDHISDSFGTPASIPVWQLPNFIKRLENAGFSAKRHLVWLHMELALPVFLAGIVLIGAAFTVHHSRVQQTSLMVLFAVLAGFGLYFVRNFGQILGENGQINPLLAAWVPNIVAFGLALSLLLHTEDG